MLYTNLYKSRKGAMRRLNRERNRSLKNTKARPLFAPPPKNQIFATDLAEVELRVSADMFNSVVLASKIRKMMKRGRELKFRYHETRKARIVSVNSNASRIDLSYVSSGSTVALIGHTPAQILSVFEI